MTVQIAVSRYQKLIDDITNLYQKARKSLSDFYWGTGQRIVEVEQQGESHAPHGESLLKRLSKDLTRRLGAGFSVTNLQRMRLIYLEKRKYSAPNILSWTHQVELQSIADPKKRANLEKKAIREGLTSRQIRTLVKAQNPSRNGKKFRANSAGLQPGTYRMSELLKPKKGELFTYQIVKDAGQLAIDHGFTSFWNLSAREAARFSEGDIVRRLPSGGLTKVKGATKAQLYTYEADVVRVVDGDTIWMKIFLEGRNRPPWLKEKLRLRDIDAPELYKKADAVAPHEMSKSRRAVLNPPGLRAKKFVEEQIAGKKVLITTTKPDKWDRYLSDIFLSSPGKPEIFLNNLLLENGHARIKTDWSLSDWEEN